MSKYVYFFGGGKADGKAEMKKLLGGKGANLAEMTNLGIPVPAGYTISTETCNYYQRQGCYPEGLQEELSQNLNKLEKISGKKLGDAQNPLLVSVRSGAAVSMPGMMDTVLNLGLNDETVKGLIKKTTNERFGYDAYRRFVQMFANVVLQVKHNRFEQLLEEKKKAKGVRFDTQLEAADLKELVEEYKQLVRKEKGIDFPDDPYEQLKKAYEAVFSSWNNQRAITYRALHDIPDNLGTAVNVQTMVFGNMGEDSGTGVAFTRNPSTGEKKFYGEYLLNAQGEDVVAGIRTPEHIDRLEREMPAVYQQLEQIYQKLESHYRDMQDMEFTVEKGELFILQTRTGKRTAHSAVKVAVDMVGEELLSKKEALMRVDPAQIDQLLHPMIDPQAKAEVITRGLPASPGAAVGKVVFTAKDAQEKGKTEKVILVRLETSPEDIGGMAAAQGILTARGGMTCIAGDSLILTKKGFFTAEEVFDKIENNEGLNILSYDCKKDSPVWKKIIACGRRKSKIIKIKTSQTARTEHNFLKITPDHKMYTFQNRKLIKKPLKEILNKQEFICLVDKIPQLKNSVNNEKLAYLVGAILTDGCIQLKRTKGCVTFTQKRDSKKTAFIEQVNSYFYQVFGIKFRPPRTKISRGYLRGRYIHGEVIDLICSRKEPARILKEISQNLVTWVLNLDKTSCLNFLAGAIDGDGTFNSYENSRIMLYVSKEPLAQAIIVTCLKLGIIPQVTVNRNIYNIQILEKLDEILKFTKRVKADLRERVYGTKLFSARGMFSDVIDEVNFMGRPKECIKRNLLMDAEKIKRDILPLCCPNPVRKELSRVLNSNLRMYRIKKAGNESKSLVYNFEVESDDELNKNYIAFTKMYTPLLISNSHAAVVARGMGKCCVAGCESIVVNEKNKNFSVGDLKVKEGEYITLNGSSGEVILGKVHLIEPTLSSDFNTLMNWADELRRLKVRSNADTPEDAVKAREFGAEGIGLCRTEHMFFGKERISIVRQMILAKDRDSRLKALDKLLPMQREDFKAIFEAMRGLPVTIRLLDPPLHEFLPQEQNELEEISRQLGIAVEELEKKIQGLDEINPMLGHRGCRLGITYPEISEMQARAIFEAAAELTKQGVTVIPEIMVPLIGEVEEFNVQKKLIVEVGKKVMQEQKIELNYLIGTMIEIPRAALTADEIAKEAEFFSFGTNDLTQMTFGFSRDDAGKFLPAYIEKGILKQDPFAVIDQKGVGQLVKLGVERGRSARPDLKIGICGEHGGEPSSVEFCHRIGLDYVSCSPFRVPIARLAAAQAVIKNS